MSWDFLSPPQRDTSAWNTVLVEIQKFLGIHLGNPNPGHNVTNDGDKTIEIRSKNLAMLAPGHVEIDQFYLVTLPEVLPVGFAHDQNAIVQVEVVGFVSHRFHSFIAGFLGVFFTKNGPREHNNKEDPKRSIHCEMTDSAAVLGFAGYCETVLLRIECDKSP